MQSLAQGDTASMQQNPGLPTLGRHSRVRPGAHGSSPSSYLSVVEPGLLLQAGAVTWLSPSRAPVTLGQREHLGPDRLGEVCCYPPSREQRPKKQKTVSGGSHWLPTGILRGELKPYPRPINQSLWGGAQALVFFKLPQVNSVSSQGG